MIKRTIDVLIASANVTSIVNSRKITPVDRVQGVSNPQIVVTHTDTRTNPTKHLTSSLDFHDVEIAIYGESPLEVEKIAWYVRDELDYHTETSGAYLYECRFNNCEMGKVEGEETYLHIIEVVWSETRLAVSAHS